MALSTFLEILASIVIRQMRLVFVLNPFMVIAKLWFYPKIWKYQTNFNG